MTRGRKPTIAIIDKGVRPGGGPRTSPPPAFAPAAEPPAELTADEAVRYRELVGNVAFGHLAAVDQPLVVAYLRHGSIHRQAVKELCALKELSVETAASTRMHPLIQITCEQAKTILNLANELGLTPLSRQRLKLPADPVGTGWDSLSS
jgi:phage terminase small subunit